MKIAVTGHNGFVGSELVRRGCIPIEGDILSEHDLYVANRDIAPDLVIHCAAMTSVDRCEQDPQEAFEVNVNGTMNVINEFHKCPIIYLSTDHVFNGKYRLWLPDEKSKPDPINVYGLTKYAGEVMMKTCTKPYLIVRSSKLFSLNSLRKDMYALLQGEKKEYTGLIHRNFTHVSHFVSMLLLVANSGFETNPKHDNYLHLATPVSMSYYSFWKMVADRFGIDKNLITERRFSLPDVSPRPFRGGLDTKRVQLYSPLYSVSDGLDLAYKEFEETFVRKELTE